MEIEEGGDGQKSFEILKTQILAAQKVAAEVANSTATQKDLLDTLLKRIDAASDKVAAIEALRSQAEAAVKVIEEATRKANSEAGYAFNAKGNAEEHAKAISQIRGTVEATFSGLTASKQSIEELVQAVTTLRNAADGDAKTISAAKTSAARDAATVTAASERVAAVLPSINQGSADANAITAAKSGAEAASAAILALQKEMSEATAKATTDSASISKSAISSKKSAEEMAAAASLANDTNARISEYEDQLDKLKTAFSEMHAKLESKLPHATSAGLASAFHIQKARFSKSQVWWIGLFASAIAGLLLAAFLGLPKGDTWDEILRHFVNRLPIVAPLIWLAVYAGHHYNMALRLEEDYAFKEAVSTAFEGYKREMQGIPARDGSSENPLVTLCENVLRALAERPGRIYEGKTEVLTPLTPVSNIVKDTIAEFVKAKNQTSG